MEMIGIFIEFFSETEQLKDPGLIADTILGEGSPVTVYYYRSNSLNPNIGYKTKKITKKQSHDPAFWRSEKISSIIVYSWLSIRYSKIIRALYLAKVASFLKLDSDGNLLYPSRPSYLRVFGLNYTIKSKIEALLRRIQWSVFSKYVSIIRIKQIELSKGVIIETPEAKNNLKRGLIFWNKRELINKIHVIQNPISNLSKEVLNNEKENYIISIGRWDDKRKNKKVLIQTLLDFQRNESWKIIILGNGSLEIKNYIKSKKRNIEIEAHEYVSHAEVCKLLRKSKIFLIPSLAEGFNVAACEAVTLGCSVVGTPLECLKYLSKNGFSGNTSESIFISSLGDVLNKEVVRWNIEEKYDSKLISKYWQHELGRSRIGSLLRLILF